jgi:SPP1 gp7 family putative phage head morphogenesis protein
VIGRQADSEHRKWMAAIESAVADMVSEGMTRIELERLGTDARSSEAVGRFDLDAMKARAVNTQVSRMLRAGFAIGEDHARREIDAAKKQQFARRLSAERLGDMAAEWLKQKAFTVTGDLKAGAVKEIKNVLVNGLKYNWSQAEVKRNVYKALVSKGFLTGASAADALGMDDQEALARELDLQGGLTAARLDTVVRTNMFEAINEARLDAYTDPALDGFVTALQYSSILDSRTTPICEHMDGRTYTAAQWEGELRPWVPPNHFNCRSLIIPVTVADEDAAQLTQDLPRIEPQEGFG